VEYVNDIIPKTQPIKGIGYFCIAETGENNTGRLDRVGGLVVKESNEEIP